MELIYIAKIVRAHGLEGNVVVDLYGNSAESFRPGLKVLIDPDGESLPLAVESVRRHGKAVVARFSGISGRDAAEAAAGKEIAVSKDLLGELPRGEFYVFDLIGCTVVSEDGNPAGIVADVMDNPGNDLLEVDDNGKRFYVPLVKAFIERIELKERVIVVRNIEGLAELGN